MKQEEWKHEDDNSTPALTLPLVPEQLQVARVPQAAQIGQGICSFIPQHPYEVAHTCFQSVTPQCDCSRDHSRVQRS